MVKSGKTTSVAKNRTRGARGAVTSKSRAAGGRKRADPASRALAGSGLGAPLAISTAYKTTSYMPDETVRGCDFLQTVSVPSGTADGHVVYNWFVSPTTVNARLAAIGRIWERYQFKKLKVKYVPAVPATTAGALTFAYDPDCSDATPSAYTRETLFALDDNLTTSIFAPCELVIKKLDQNTLYYTGANTITADERLELQGQLYVAYTGPPPVEGVLAGTIMLEYEIHFSKRCFETPVPSALPTPADSTLWASGIDVLSSLANGILSAIYLAGARFSAGKMTFDSKGLFIGPRSNLHLLVSLAMTALAGTNGGNVLYKVHPILRDAAGSVLKHLNWSKGKAMYTGLAEYSSSAGSDPYGYQLTNGIEVTTASTNVDYLTGGLEIHNDGAYPVYLDFTVATAYATYPLTEVLMRGMNACDLDAITYAGLYDSSPNTVSKIPGVPVTPDDGAFACTMPQPDDPAAAAKSGSAVPMKPYGSAAALVASPTRRPL